MNVGPDWITEEKLTELRERRMDSLIGVWEQLCSGVLNKERLYLNPDLINEVVEHYIADYRVMKWRYNIQGRIQLHKIAGLIACAILRYRPILPKDGVTLTEDELRANELYAVYHGIAVCAEYHRENLKITKEPFFLQWLDNFTFLLHYRNYTPEAIIFVFETFSWFAFPKNFTTEETSD